MEIEKIAFHLLVSVPSDCILICQYISKFFELSRTSHRVVDQM